MDQVCEPYIHQPAQLFVQLDAITDKPNPHVLFDELLHFLKDIAPKQAHQSGNFDLRALPVFGRKRKNRQVFDVIFRAGLDDFTYTTRTGVVAQRPLPSIMIAT